jgi:hypothetical protein
MYWLLCIFLWNSWIQSSGSVLKLSKMAPCDSVFPASFLSLYYVEAEMENSDTCSEVNNDDIS